MLREKKAAGKPAPLLFLGSRTSSLFRHAFLAEQLKGLSNHILFLLNMTPLERFGECYHLLEKHFNKQDPGDAIRTISDAIHNIISNALQEKQSKVTDICNADKYVAALMKQKMFQCIITTNIANDLDFAFPQSGLQESRDFEVVIPGPGEFTAGETRNDYTFKIIKASGDVLSRKYSVCGYNIDNTEIFLDKYSELKDSLESMKKEDMVMVGFDHEWDRHVLHIIFPREGNLWYVNEGQTPTGSQLFYYLKAGNARRLEDSSGGYETFFWNLLRQFFESVPTGQDQITLNKLNSMEHMLKNSLGSVNSELQWQKTMMEEMKEDLQELNTKVELLLPLVDCTSQCCLEAHQNKNAV